MCKFWYEIGAHYLAVGSEGLQGLQLFRYTMQEMVDAVREDLLC